jgi:(1->4)-alpha-D-glucan 1-alpha-D-glucosylmutase
MDDHTLDQMCARWGVDVAYADIWGHRHPASRETKEAILAALGALAQDGARADARDAGPALSAVCRLCVGEVPATITARFAPHRAPSHLNWRLALESGEVHAGEWHADATANADRATIVLPVMPPAGYHTFELSDPHSVTAPATTRLIVAPARCFGGRAGQQRMFGPAVQLYALRSHRNWGIGDFTDLATLVELAAAQGADLVGVNPLHALFPADPEASSPYSPSNRRMLNVLYIDVEAIAEFAECEAARVYVATPTFREQLARLRTAPLVAYAGVASLKFDVLAMLYRQFRDRHLSRNTTRARAFREFQASGGDDLRKHAVFEALREALSAADPRAAPASWPAAFRDPGSPEVAAFTQAHHERVEFFEYLQWVAQEQLTAVADRARAAGMAVGLYRDLAVGVNDTGSEAWHDAPLFAHAMHVGAPPDEFNQKGQDWGLPPWIPQRLEQARFDSWTSVLRANMRFAGALRIDHVMGLFRLYWIPVGTSADRGAYVRYPFDDLLAILAVESQRAGCLVIGEDLGTVPDAVREAMTRLGIFSYRVLFFERRSDGSFAPPSDYPADALATIGTHDLPTLKGFLEEADLRAREELDLFPSPEAREDHYALRRSDRTRLSAALRDARLLGESVAGEAPPALPFDDALVRAVHAYVARTPSRLMTFQLEDVFGATEQINLPTTTEERYPNWRRKLPLDLESYGSDGRFAAVCAAIRAEGRGACGTAQAILAHAP